MKIRHSKTPLPDVFHPLHGGIVHEARIKVTKHSRLCAKLLIFDNHASLKDFFERILDRRGSVTDDTRGIVTALSWKVTCFSNKEQEKEYIEVDPRYFCLIGLIMGYLRMDIICHEAVHAAFNYKERQNRRLWDDGDNPDHEEEICYPAGIIASRINSFCHNEGLYHK